MDKEKLEKWLNRLAKSVKQLTNIKDFDEDVARFVKTKCETKCKNKAAMT